MSERRIRTRIEGASFAATGLLLLFVSCRDASNDAPKIDRLEVPEDESSGFVPVRLRVSDTTGDTVSIQAEWRPSDGGDDGWKIATPLDASLDEVETERDGTTRTFLWDTGKDLPGIEGRFVLRFTPDDGARDASGTPVGTGVPSVSPPFRVDNNEAPILDVLGEVFIGNTDDRRGIPIPYRLTDRESDRVEIVFQWRRLGEDYPALPEESGELAAILADPALRREHRICTSYPSHARGRAFPVDEFSLRLPELAGSHSWLLASGIEGATLDLLRPSSVPEPVSHEWQDNPLSAPVAALPLGRGLTALVLDDLGSSWRLLEIELISGATPPGGIGPLSGPGSPTALALEVNPGGEKPVAVLIAAESSGKWTIQRVVLATREVSQLFASSDGQEPPPVRGVASLGAGRAVLTAGSSLLMLDYTAPGAARAATLLEHLAAPHGVQKDPLHRQRVYVCERDAPSGASTGRIVAVDLDSLALSILPLPSIERPRSLVLERNGARMLVEVEVSGGNGRQVLGIDVGRSSPPFAVGPPIPGDIAGMASGPDGLRILAVPSLRGLWVGGGIEQEREITGYQSATGLTFLTAALARVPRPGQPWRVHRDTSLRGEPGGRDGVFVWDSRDCRSGPAFVRAVPWDGERGTSSETRAPKTVRDGLSVTPLVLGGTGTTAAPVCVRLADVDGDRDLDVVSANAGAGTLTCFQQDAAGRFREQPLSLARGTAGFRPSALATADIDADGFLDLVGTDVPADELALFFGGSGGFLAPLSIRIHGVSFSVHCADLDGDDDLDLVCTSRNRTNAGVDHLEVFWQTAPRVFDSTAPLIGLPPSADPRHVNTGDMDSDGDLDILCATVSQELLVYFQIRPGGFDPTPLVLGNNLVTTFLQSVEAADLDQDGDLDLECADVGSPGPAEGGDLTLFFQEARASFDPKPVEIEGPPPGIIALFSTAADVDADGKLDLVAAVGGNDEAPRQDDGITVFYQTAPGEFDARGSVVERSPSQRPSSLAVGDIDANGSLDVVSANSAGDVLKVLLQDGPGTFRSSTLLDGFPFLHDAAMITAADVDGDGDFDLLSAGSGLTVFMQVTPAVFDARPLDVPAGLFSVAPADLDGDGDLDLAGSTSGRVVIYFRTEEGFEPAPLGGGGPAGNAFHVKAADMDGDGDLDLVSGNDANDLAIYFQIEPGVFDAEALLLAAPSMRGSFFPLPVDVDGNGTMDLVSANSNSDNLTIFYQASPGAFAPVPEVLGASPGMDFVASVAAGDLDGDGDLDFVSGNLGSRNLAVFSQSTPGRFDPVPVLLPIPAGAPGNVAIADLDADGDEDIVSASELGSLVVFRQEAPGVFVRDASPVGDARQCTPNWVEPVDLDGDGDIDLVSVCSAFQNVVIHWGGR